MLDAFLEVIIKKEDSRLQEVKLANDLKRLPNETLYGLATGKQKLAFGYSDEWLEKYKGTPLFEQAMELEKADLEAEIAREQLHSNQPDMSQFWKTQDQIRLQKKMLDLQLIEMNEKDGLQMQPGGMLPESITPTAQGAGALGDVAAEGAQQGEAAKMAAANFKKTAFQMGGLAGHATRLFEAAKAHPMASKALEFAVKNPEAVGAGVGAVGGAIAGGPGHRLSGAAGGAALGAGAGAAGKAIAPGYKTLRDAGLNRMDSFTTAARGAKDNFVANMKDRFNVPAPAPVAVKNAGARFKLAAAKMKMPIEDAMGYFEPELETAVYDHGLGASARYQALRDMQQSVNSADQDQQWSAQHPVLNRLRGTAGGGTVGALLGGTLGLASGKPLQGAAFGGLAGGALGTLAVRSSERKAQDLEDLRAAHEAITEHGIDPVLHHTALSYLSGAPYGFDDDVEGPAKQRLFNQLSHGTLHKGK